jgi:hypothetical protein
MCQYDGEKVIITTEYYNAFYVNGRLVHESKPDYLDTETLHNLWPEASYYGAYELEEEGEFEDGYPELLSGVDLSRCDKYA